MTKKISLNDKYILKEGKIFLTGIQALVRLPIIQKGLDEKNDLNTGGFISGYKGSPLGGYDLELFRAKKYLDENQNLILAILENQNVGRLAECARYQNRLQQNLMYLASIVDE